MLKLLQKDLWEEFCRHCCLCHWSAQLNKIFGRNFVIIEGFVSGLLTFFMMLKLLQQDLWEEFRHHCRLCQWSLNVLNDALSHQPVRAVEDCQGWSLNVLTGIIYHMLIDDRD